MSILITDYLNIYRYSNYRLFQKIEENPYFNHGKETPEFILLLLVFSCGKKLIKILNKKGFEIKRSKGSHVQLEDTGGVVFTCFQNVNKKFPNYEQLF
jgi:hypothetical protein